MSSVQFSNANNGRLNGMQNILDGKYDICQGLHDLCEALKDLRCGREYEAQINVVNGIRHIKEGLCRIKVGLCMLHNEISCEERALIREGFREICRALDALCGVLKDICCGCIREAEKNLACAIKCIKQGFCKINRGLEGLNLCD